MIRVTVIDDERIIQSVSDIKGEGVLMAWAQENEKSPGHCIFTDAGEIKTIKDNDNVFELLVRATLNYLDLNGVKKGFCLNDELFEGLKKLGFKETGNGYEVDITTFFKPCCHK